jgi:hypothetical protein
MIVLRVKKIIGRIYMSNKANNLAQKHWEYVKSLLLAHDLSEKDAEQIGFHYKTAFVHGFKHGMENSATRKNGR